MTTIPITLDELAATRDQLIADIRNRLDDNTRQFLLGLHRFRLVFSLTLLIWQRLSGSAARRTVIPLPAVTCPVPQGGSDTANLLE